MRIEDFEDIVDEAVEDLPDDFRQALDNAGIVVELWPTEEEMQRIKLHPGSLLFGLYQGIPKTKRGSNYSALPDKISIFIGPILMVSKNLEDAKGRIKKTVLHEIGHHFGMSEEMIREAEESILS
ncbi:metallopeptidase family protein [Candidatus Daviesbacteria bacterium]|nr:metallopeptidase family protein [Candidatus Daviesbacteria bacterium]